jgi:hypothetical protein
MYPYSGDPVTLPGILLRHTTKNVDRLTRWHGSAPASTLDNVIHFEKPIVQTEELILPTDESVLPTEERAPAVQQAEAFMLEIEALAAAVPVPISFALVAAA